MRNNEQSSSEYRRFQEASSEQTQDTQSVHELYAEIFGRSSDPDLVFTEALSQDLDKIEQCIVAAKNKIIKLKGNKENLEVVESHVLFRIHLRSMRNHVQHLLDKRKR